MPQADLRRCIEEGTATLRGLLIGVSQYEYLRPLNYGAADGREFSEVLEESTKDFPKRSSVFAHYDDSNLELTKDAIERSLQTIESEIASTDVFLFYFSGHGAVSQDDGKLYLCLPETQRDQLEATALSMQELLERFDHLNSQYHVIILDACHSGNVSLGRSKDIGDYRTRSIEPLDDDDPAQQSDGAGPISFDGDEDTAISPQLTDTIQSYSDRLRSRKTLCALLSCKAHEVSWELPEKNHGAFTCSLIEGFRRSETADSEGFITTDLLNDYVRKNTLELVKSSQSQEQTPDRIAVGETIVIGKRLIKSSISPDATLAARIDSYASEYETAIRQHYPLMPGSKIRRKLDFYAKEIGLSPNKKQQIEQELDQGYQYLYEQYRIEIQNSVIDRREGLPTREKLALLRQAAGIDKYRVSEEVLARLEQEAIDLFNDYRLKYRAALHQYGQYILFKDRRDIERVQRRLNLSDADAESIVADEEKRFQSNYKRVEEAIAIVLHQNGGITKAEIQQCQSNPPLGQALIDNILREQEQCFQEHQQCCREKVHYLLHSQGELSEEQVQHLVSQDKDLNYLGSCVIQKIYISELNQFHNDLERFKKKLLELKKYCLEYGDLPEQDIQVAQRECNLGKAVTETLISRIFQQFAEAKMSYLLVFERIMGKEGLRTSTEDKLELKNLASRLQLGADAISKIEEDYLNEG